MLVHVLAAPLIIQVAASAPEKTVEDGPNFGACATQGGQEESS